MTKGRDTENGSKEWMQTIINSNAVLQLNKQIGEYPIEWISPLADLEYKEYQLNNEIVCSIFNFNKQTFSDWWEFERQPQWDAIGKICDTIVLVEAKGHLRETNSKCRAVEKSYAKIRDRLKKTHSNMDATIPFDEEIWLRKHYQTANRLLFWDNLRHYLKTILVFLNFTNIRNTKRKTATADKWNKHLDEVFMRLLGYGIKSLPHDIRVINFDTETICVNEYE